MVYDTVHYYRTGLWSCLFVLATVGPETNERFGPSRAGKRRVFWSRKEQQTGTKCPLFVSIGSSNRDQQPLGPLVPVRATNRDK